MSTRIRAATPQDVAQIVEMVNRFAAQNIMLPRTEENVRETIADWLVAVEESTPTPGAHHPIGKFTRRHRDSRRTSIDVSIGETSGQASTPVLTIPPVERVVGCGALVPLTDKLVEIRSVAVDESQHGKGVGSELVLHLVKAAREHGYEQACALTLRPNFFSRLGFELVDRWSISPKVWQACIYCSKFHRCDEVAVLMNLASQPVVADEAEQARQQGWNTLLKWGEWQPLRLAYRYEHYATAHQIKE